MKHYAYYGHKDFVIALGYKGEVIKRYMVDYASLESNLTVDLQKGQVVVHDGPRPDWRVELVDTGLRTQTGGRIKGPGGAADLLGMNPSTLYSRMKKLGIPSRNPNGQS